MVGLCKICHNALLCFLNILTSLQTKLAAFTQLTKGQFSQVTDNMEKSLTLHMRRQETSDTNKGWTMFHMMMIILTTLTTPDALQMHRWFSTAVCYICVVGSIQYTHYIYSQQHTLIHILLLNAIQKHNNNCEL
jgi:hypothetical protein